VPGSAQFTVNVNGSTYTFWGQYTNSFNSQFLWGQTSGNSNCVDWFLYITPANSTYSYVNPHFNIADSSFNGFWTNGNSCASYQLFPGTMTPTLTPASGFATNSTVAWQFGDNWYFNISGTNLFNLTLAQDWKAQVATLKENHKIFLYASQATTISFSQTTNQWLWQNRQGLAAVAPTSLASNETMTIDITHIGGQTNWLATFDATTATSTIESGYPMPSASINGATNFYWLDFGHQNPDGGNAIYASLSATNSNTEFIGLTNAAMWDSLSVNIDAIGLNSIILVPDSWPHFNTNGWTHVAPFYSLPLTNGNELRLTVQTNYSTLSTTWQTTGQ
jgi:hypothetical protein